MKNKVSIIIPFYKVENQIVQCLNSVLEQTYKNIEVICVGRKDDTSCVNIVKKYINNNNNSNFKCIFQSGKGVGDARNAGKKVATGDYVLFLDGDDYIEKNTVEMMMDAILKDESDMVCCGFDRIDEITKKIYSKEMINMNYDVLTINEENFKNIAFIAPCPWGKLIKKDIVSLFDFSSKPVAGEDLIFFLEIMKKIKKISFIKETLWHYLVRKDSLIFETNIEKAYELNNNLIEVRKEYENNNFFKSYLETIDVICFMHLAISMFSRILNKDKKNAQIYIKNIKNSLNNNFVYWDKAKIRINGKITIKTLILSFSRILLKCNCLIALIWFYNFIINTFKIDIKW